MSTEVHNDDEMERQKDAKEVREGIEGEA